MSNSIKLSKPNRPLFIWIVTAVNIIFAVILLATSFKGRQWGIPAAQIAFWALLGLGICVSTLLTWFGSRYGRNAMLALITIYLGLVLLQSVQGITWAANSTHGDGYMIRVVGRAVFAVLWLIANYWLLLGRRARIFFA